MDCICGESMVSMAQWQELKRDYGTFGVVCMNAITQDVTYGPTADIALKCMLDREDVIYHYLWFFELYKALPNPYYCICVQTQAQKAGVWLEKLYGLGFDTNESDARESGFLDVWHQLANHGLRIQPWLMNIANTVRSIELHDALFHYAVCKLFPSAFGVAYQESSQQPVTYFGCSEQGALLAQSYGFRHILFLEGIVLTTCRERAIQNAKDRALLTDKKHYLLLFSYAKEGLCLPKQLASHFLGVERIVENIPVATSLGHLALSSLSPSPSTLSPTTPLALSSTTPLALSPTTPLASTFQQ